jgi:uncharacterized membrane protein
MNDIFKPFLLFFLLGTCSNMLLPAQSETLSLSRETVKLTALKVLETHCNDCHATQRNTIFTLENMDKKAKKINRQVFITRRMPKGKPNRDRMTTEEMNALKTWIATIID